MVSYKLNIIKNKHYVAYVNLTTLSGEEAELTAKDFATRFPAKDGYTIRLSKHTVNDTQLKF